MQHVLVGYFDELYESSKKALAVLKKIKSEKSLETHF